MNKNKIKSQRLVKMTQCELPEHLHCILALILLYVSGTALEHWHTTVPKDFPSISMTVMESAVQHVLKPGDGIDCRIRFMLGMIYRKISVINLHFSCTFPCEKKNPTTAKCLTQCGKKPPKTTKRHRIFLNFRDGALYIIIS